MLTKERLQDIFYAHTTALSEKDIILPSDEFDKVFSLILEDQEKQFYHEKEATEAAQWLIDREDKTRRHYGSYKLLDRIQNHIGDEERNAQIAIADKKQLIEDALVYFRSVVMIAESIGMAGTHAEKSARLRGLIELLNSAISKLRKEQTDSILNNWEMFHWGYSDYPYKRILENYSDLQRQNDDLKKIAEKYAPKDEIPF